MYKKTNTNIKPKTHPHCRSNTKHYEMQKQIHLIQLAVLSKGQNTPLHQLDRKMMQSGFAQNQGQMKWGDKA